MKFNLACDSCDFTDVVEAEETAYTTARDHEADCPDHFVDITER